MLWRCVPGHSTLLLFYLWIFWVSSWDDDKNNNDDDEDGDDTFQKCSGGIQGHPRIKLLAIACANDIRVKEWHARQGEDCTAPQRSYG